MAEPGGICVSRAVVDHVKQKVLLAFELRGEERLKNISEPVSVFRVRLEGTQARYSPPVDHEAHAMRLSPLDPRLFIWQFMTALAHYCAGRHNEAISWAESSLRDQPNFASALRILVASLALEGRFAEAQKATVRLRTADPALRASKLDDVMPPFRRHKDRDKYIEGLRRAGLPE